MLFVACCCSFLPLCVWKKSCKSNTIVFASTSFGQQPFQVGRANQPLVAQNFIWLENLIKSSINEYLCWLLCEVARLLILECKPFESFKTSFRECISILNIKRLWNRWNLAWVWIWLFIARLLQFIHSWSSSSSSKIYPLSLSSLICWQIISYWNSKFIVVACFYTKEAAVLKVKWSRYLSEHTYAESCHFQPQSEPTNKLATKLPFKTAQVQVIKLARGADAWAMKRGVALTNLALLPYSKNRHLFGIRKTCCCTTKLGIILILEQEEPKYSRKQSLSVENPIRLFVWTIERTS